MSATAHYRIRTVSQTLLCGAAVLSLTHAGAASPILEPPIITESFEYNSPTLAGQNGGTGWSGSWKSDDNLTTDSTVAVQSSSLDAPDGYFGTPTGGSAIAEDGEIMVMYRGFENPIDMDTDQDYYMSILMRRTGTPKSTSFALQSGTTTVAQFGHSTGGTMNILSPGDNAFGDSAQVGVGPVNLLIVKIAAKSGTGEDQLFMSNFRGPFDTLGSQTVPFAPPDTWEVVGSKAVTNDLITQFAVFRGDDGTFELDEIRIGTEWQNIAGIPEPATVGLLGAGLILVTRRRR